MSCNPHPSSPPLLLLSSSSVPLPPAFPPYVLLLLFCSSSSPSPSLPLSTSLPICPAPPSSSSAFHISVSAKEGTDDGHRGGFVSTQSRSMCSLPGSFYWGWDGRGMGWEEGGGGGGGGTTASRRSAQAVTTSLTQVRIAPCSVGPAPAIAPCERAQKWSTVC